MRSGSLSRVSGADSAISGARRRQVLAFVLVAAFAGLVLGHYHDRFWWPPDEGAYAHVADRILGGEILNLDVQDIHLGYVNFMNALAFRLFGDDLVSLRYPLAVLGLLQSCLIFLLLAPRGVAPASAASVSMTALSFVQFLNPTAHWYGLFFFITIVCALSWRPRDSRWRLEILGFLVVTLLLFRQLSGVIAAIGVLAYLLLEAPRGARDREGLLARALVTVMAAGLGAYLLAKTDALAFILFGLWPMGILIWLWRTADVENRTVLRVVSRFAVGGAAAALPLVLYHALLGSLAAWFDDTVLSAVTLTQLRFMQAGGYAVLLIQGLRQAVSLQSPAAALNGLFWCAVTLLAMVQGYLVLRRLLRGDKAASALHPLPFLAVFYALVSVHYQIPIYLFYTAGVSLAGLLWLTAGGRSWRRYAPAAFACALSAIALHYQAAQPLSRGFRGILAGERIALVPSDGLDRASLRMEAEDRRLYRALVDMIRREVGPEETILAIPVNPELYFLSRRQGPFRFFNSALGLRNDEDLKSALETLARRPPKLVFYRPDDKYNTAYSSEIMAFVERRYELFDARRGLQIYRHRPGSPNRPPGDRRGSRP